MKWKKQILLFLLVVLTSKVNAQKYLTTTIRAKADSILIKYIGDTIFKKYSIYDEGTFFNYENTAGNQKSKPLNKRRITKHKFVSARMGWDLVIPYPKCPAFDTIKGWTVLYLDSLLNPIGQPYLSFIPDFYWSQDSCHLLTEHKAIEIAKSQDLKKGIDSLKATISYDAKTKKFEWRVSHILWSKRNFRDHDYGEFENVLIDAKTGLIKSHTVDAFRPIY